MSTSEAAKRILIISAISSGGHRVCAQAIARSWQVYGKQKAEVFCLDWTSHFCPGMGKIVFWFYLKLVCHFPLLWAAVYDNSAAQFLTFPLIRLISFLKSRKIKSFLASYRPDLIICTHAFPCRLLAEQKRRGLFSAPLIAVSTDYLAHSYWAHPSVDFYCLASEDSAALFSARGVQSQRLHALGIPVDLSFSEPRNTTAARTVLGLNQDRPVVLIMGGSLRLGPIQQIVQAVQRVSPEIQTLVAGGNDSNIALWMDACDVLISKPGGLTCAEAMAKGVPMLISNGISGQESRNASYLLRAGAALRARSMQELEERLRELLFAPEKLSPLRERAQAVARPNAGKILVERLETMLLGRVP